MDSLIFPKGVTFTPLRRIHNPKGDVLHALKSSEDSFRGFGEAYFTIINPAETKGWKRHKKMFANLIVPIGEVRFLIKISEGLPPFEIVIGENFYGRLTISPGYWVAFTGVAEKASLVLNIADIIHDPMESEDMSVKW